MEQKNSNSIRYEAMKKNMRKKEREKKNVYIYKNINKCLHIEREIKRDKKIVRETPCKTIKTNLGVLHMDQYV